MTSLATTQAAPAGSGDPIVIPHISFPREVLEAEIERVRKDLPRSFDATARILALARPVVEVALLESGYGEEPERPRGARGKTPIPATAIVLVHFLAQLKTVGSYRQVPRVLANHPAWLKALGLRKAPDHTTLSKFRTRTGPEFFRRLFRVLVAMLAEFNLVTPGEDAIVDSAPVKACMNFARANKVAELDPARVRAFFGAVDFAPAVALVPVAGRGRPPAYTPLAMVRFLVLEKLAGFMSRSLSLRYLAKHPAIAAAVGFPKGKIPTGAAVLAFERKVPPASVLVRPLVSAITDFFDAREDYDDADPLSFFFWVPEGRQTPAGPGR